MQLVIKLLVFVLLSFSAFSLTFAQPKIGKVGQSAEGKKAMAVVNEVISAYGNGDINFIRDRMDPKMIGLQKMLNGVIEESTRCKQLRIHLKDTQVQAAPDVVVIQTGWEKRCLKLPTLSAQYFSGHSTFMLEKMSDNWTIKGIAGANPIAQSVFTAAASSTTPSATSPTSSTPTFPCYPGVPGYPPGCTP